MEATKSIISKDGTEILASEGQFFAVSESGKTIGLWQAEPLLLIKRFHKANVLWEIPEEEK